LVGWLSTSERKKQKERKEKEKKNRVFCLEQDLIEARRRQRAKHEEEI
jgi:hypothetical protein